MSLWVGLVLMAEPRLRRELHRFGLPPRSTQWLGAGLVVVWLLNAPAVGPGLIVTLTVAFGWILRGAVCRCLWQERTALPEAWRLTLLLGAGCLLMLPYASPRLVGGGDAEHYARQLTDFLTQVEQGQFPVWVGLSLHAFEGSVHPLRTAPYFQHAGGLLNVLTAGKLAPVALQNLLLGTSFMAALVGAYFALCVVAPTRRGECGWLALLYGTSPGVLALLYGGDMFASWMTLPWLPWLFLGWVLAWREPMRVRGLGLQAGALALLWLAHAPIALWATAMTLISELARLVQHKFSPRLLVTQVGAATICGVLCHYVFVAVATLEVPNNPYLEFQLARGAVFEELRANWSGWFRLVSPGGNELLHDLHLSAGLLLVGTAGLVVGWRVGGVARVIALLLAALGLLLMPVAGVTDRFWAALPGFLITVTEKWPMQRLYPLLSALLPFLGALALAHPWFSRPLSRRLIPTVLMMAVMWGGWEARKFVAHGQAATRGTEATARFLLPENNTLSRYSYEMWGYLPKYFSFGYMDLETQNRLIDPTSGRVFASNERALLAAKPNGTTHRFVPAQGGGSYWPAITLPPGEACYLNFDFGASLPRGTLRVDGGRFARCYELPAAGGAASFGPGPGRKNGFTVRNHGSEPEQILVRFVSEDPAAVTCLGTLTALPYAQIPLPFRLRHLFPFELDVSTDEGGWVETPKILIPGYAAMVDGKSAEVRRSPDGLVMVAVPPGEHRLRLDYVPPTMLVMSFWLTGAAWTALVAGVLLRVSGPFRLRQWLAGWSGWRTLTRLGWVGGGLAAVSIIAIVANHRLNGQRSHPPSSPAAYALTVQLPVGRHAVFESLLSWADRRGAISSVVVYYENDRSIRLGCRKNGRLKILTEALPVSYFVPQEVECVIGARLTDGDRRHYAQLSEKEWRKLRRSIRVAFNGHAVWQTGSEHQTNEGLRFSIGREIGPARPDVGIFRGDILSWSENLQLLQASDR